MPLCRTTEVSQGEKKHGILDGRTGVAAAKGPPQNNVRRVEHVRLPGHVTPLERRVVYPPRRGDARSQGDAVAVCEEAHEGALRYLVHVTHDDEVIVP